MNSSLLSAYCMHFKRVWIRFSLDAYWIDDYFASLFLSRFWDVKQPFLWMGSLRWYPKTALGRRLPFRPTKARDLGSSHFSICEKRRGVSGLWTFPSKHAHVLTENQGNFKMSRKRKVVADEDEDPTKVDFETSEEVDVVPTFDQLKLREDLLRGVYAYGMSRSTHMERKAEGIVRVEHCSAMLIYPTFSRLGFEKPSAIQQRAIKPIIKGRDVIAQ